MSKAVENLTCVHFFETDIRGIDLPKKFNFPFYYTPHILCEIAACEIQETFLSKNPWKHNFGLDPEIKGLVIGKMFGVLIVQLQSGSLGYLAAFSGKLAGENHHKGFVPPVFDILSEGSFFLKTEEELNEINRKIELLEANPEYIKLKSELEYSELLGAEQLQVFRQKMKIAKNARKSRRTEAKKTMSLIENADLLEKLKTESLSQQYHYKQLSQYWEEKKNQLLYKLNEYTSHLASLKKERKEKSGSLQNRIFNEYYFLNQDGIRKSLHDIFYKNLGIKPPAGAGECAAPKLLHYAFSHQLKPIALAEFWWGESPKSEIRKHKQFYPSCRSKCEPILGHMLEGMEVDENPMLELPNSDLELPIIYEDAYLLVVNKPPEFLSVPGKNIRDSVQTRMQEYLNNYEDPLLVHRLDMSTSGILLVAKSKSIHQNLQSQFIKRKVQKEYIAVLDGLIDTESGTIDLPLRVDLDNRPHQLVCYEHGKKAVTKYKVIDVQSGKTRILFYPITGRTHQLRVHAAHSLGLNAPILGDDLYGVPADRLHLHARSLRFNHPIKHEEMTFVIEADF